jgi:glucose-6-phosphate 1-epimerase
LVSAEVVEYRGMPAVRWESRDGACAIATLQGAHLVSWKPAGGEECLYVSERSPFEAGRAIRGGVPIVFPQFADRGGLPQHGFARTQPWSFEGSDESRDGCAVSFALQDSPQTMALWPHPFRLLFSARIAGPRLDMQLRVVNTGKSEFDFAAALHTYFRVADAAATHLHGLRATRCMDRGSSTVDVESREVIGAAEAIDRVYFAAPDSVCLEAPECVLHIAQRGFTDTVVWNPGVDRTARMADMPPDGFRYMLCVEAAAIEPRVALAPDGAWCGEQSIEVSRSRTPESR